MTITLDRLRNINRTAIRGPSQNRSLFRLTIVIGTTRIAETAYATNYLKK
jgi:hypothetical protein